MAKILVVDDDEMIRDAMYRIIKGFGHHIQCSALLDDGLRLAESENFDIVFLDVHMPDGNGLERIPSFQAVFSKPEIIVMTGYADGSGAEIAIKSNAWDYLKKPASIDAILLTVNRALQYRSERRINRPSIRLNRQSIIGQSPKIMECLETLSKAVNNTSNILITGETGTGKELFARAIHANGPRQNMNFVVVDCAALPETIMESLLFGHTKGAFTGADKAEEGFVLHAHGGSLFLDEIGDLPFSMQNGFLRVLQEHRFNPVGGTREVESDFRLISATNRDLDAMVDTGDFREDLLYRIRTVTINLPPLRERADDINLLATKYLEALCDSHKIEMKKMSPDYIEILKSYHWPGNIRELHNCLEYSFFHSQFESTIFPKHIPNNIRSSVLRRLYENETNYADPLNWDDLSGKIPKWRDFRRKQLDKIEKHYLENLISQTKGNAKEASQLSGMSSSRLYELLNKYNIPA